MAADVDWSWGLTCECLLQIGRDAAPAAFAWAGLGRSLICSEFTELHSEVLFMTDPVPTSTRCLCIHPFSKKPHAVDFYHIE